MPLSELKMPVRSVALADAARQKLLAAIVDGELEPGEILHETELASALGISRTPVREALHRLGEIDLVRADSSRGYRVTPLEPARLAQIIQVAAELVGMASRLAVPCLTDADRAWLGTVAGDVVSFGPSVSFGDRPGPLVDLFVERSGNEVLGEAIAAYQPHISRLFRLNRYSGSLQATEARGASVISALATGDVHAVEEAVRSYYEQAGLEVLEELRTARST